MTDMSGCKGCECYDPRRNICDHVIVRGVCRGIPVWPGGGCEKKASGKREKQQIWIPKTAPKIVHQNKWHRRGHDWDTEKARTLYDQGWSDRRIAAELGICAATVQRWRAEEKLPAQARKRK